MSKLKEESTSQMRYAHQSYDELKYINNREIFQYLKKPILDSYFYNQNKPRICNDLKL